MKQFRSESELFASYRKELPDEVRKDLDHLLFLYDMYLDATDPKDIAILLGEMNIIERKYNVEVTRGLDQENKTKIASK